MIVNAHADYMKGHIAFAIGRRMGDVFSGLAFRVRTKTYNVTINRDLFYKYSNIVRYLNVTPTLSLYISFCF